MQQLGINRKRTTAYHPACNGAIERFHRTLKNALRAQCNTTKWYESLPLVLLGLRSAINKEGNSPSQLLYGTSLDLPHHFFLPTIPKIQEPNHDFVQNFFTQVQKFTTPERKQNVPYYVPKDLQTATHIWLRDVSSKSSLHPRYIGPYKIVTRDPKTITIQTNKSTQKVLIDRVKPAFLEPEDLVTNDQNPNQHATNSKQRGQPKSILKQPSQNRNPFNTSNIATGTVIFAKFPGYPPWPAKVINTHNTALHNKKQPTNTTPIQFFGTNKLTFIPNDDITEYTQRFKTKHRALQRAANLAQNYLDTSKGPTTPETTKNAHTAHHPLNRIKFDLTKNTYHAI